MSRAKPNKYYNNFSLDSVEQLISNRIDSGGIALLQNITLRNDCVSRANKKCTHNLEESLMNDLPICGQSSRNHNRGSMWKEAHCCNSHTSASWGQAWGQEQIWTGKQEILSTGRHLKVGEHSSRQTFFF